jgi:hypothetical protein
MIDNGKNPLFARCIVGFVKVSGRKGYARDVTHNSLDDSCDSSAVKDVTSRVGTSIDACDDDVWECLEYFTTRHLDAVSWGTGDGPRWRAF